MDNLNLPAYNHKLKKINDKLCIWDIIRKKYIVLTPEEWVRQHFVHHLINDHHYPKGLIKLESGLSYNSLLKRTDIQVFDRLGNLFMIVECKAPYIKLSEAVFAQAAQYNLVLKAQYLTIANGMIFHCCRTDWETKQMNFLETLPIFQ
ncbi:MAG: type I restriction enzyme HsdR N-terminal domain-containing protein [Arcicella sp.]|nr:type I restriction enzyme HsdR N-terminal domain-containing protein [Arcicella sp.]